MKYIIILSIIIFSCNTESDEGVSLTFSSSNPYDSVHLYRINKNQAIFIGALQYKDHWTLSTQELRKKGIYKAFSYYDGKTATFLLIVDDTPNIHIEEEGKSLMAKGSNETKRLFEINALIHSCDQRHFKYQRKLVEFATNRDSTSHYYDLTQRNMAECKSSLKAIIRADYSSLASLYALDFLDPAKNTQLVDSVFCLSKQRYPDSYLHEEIIERHQLKALPNCNE